ncbi:MAG: multiple sugar transport system permease protein [Propionibacteriaceae bacterium]|jgi:multiple sugar transport system permease protein|nr:spermidine/putrescine transporter permease [Propionibacteriaceae bacterium]MDX6320684.1 multiple sugar transport system permease protein [Propionibacteriaceae bacterium]
MTAPTYTTVPGASRMRRGRMSTMRKQDSRAALLFISPWILGFLIFTAWPVIYSAYLSLTDYDVINSPNFIGLDNYRELLVDPKIAASLWNTFFYTVIQVPLYVIVSLAFALLLNRAGRSSGFFRTAFFLPKMTPPVAVGILLLLLFNGQSGLINTVLGWFGITGPAWTTDPNWVKPGLILISLWSVGGSVIILLAALRNVPAELYDSARVDGANWWQQTMKVTVPMISGSIFFIFVVNSIAAFQTFSEAYTAYFGSGNTTYSNDAALFYAIYLFQQAFQYLHMGYASAMAWILFVIILVITLIQMKVSKRFVYLEGDQQ